MSDASLQINLIINYNHIQLKLSCTFYNYIISYIVINQQCSVISHTINVKPQLQI